MSGAGPALLLAAGKATRLAGLRERHAKACVPVAGTTPLGFLLPRTLAAGFAPVWINLHHRAEEVEAHARALAPGADLRFVREPELLGTGGTLLEVARRSGAPPRLIANAKIFTDFDLARLAGAPPGTCVLHAGSPVAEFGGLRRDAAGRVAGLAPRGAEDSAAAVFTGLCAPHPAWIARLEAARAKRPAEPLCLIRDGLLPALAEEPGPPALVHEGFWVEISTPERVHAAEKMLVAGEERSLCGPPEAG